MPKLKIVVTQEDIEAGQPGQSGSCPIALAIKRTISDASYVEVDQYCYWEHDGDIFSASMPNEAQQFINHFDGKMVVFPFEFECEPVLQTGDDDDDEFGD